MNTASNRFLGMPYTTLGWCAVGLSLLFTVLAVAVINELINFSGFLTITLGVIAGIVTIIALIWKRERSWLVWIMLIPGLFAILFSLGEMLYPH